MISQGTHLISTVIETLLDGENSPFASKVYLDVPHQNPLRPIYEMLIDLITVFLEYYINTRVASSKLRAKGFLDGRALARVLLALG